MGRIGINARVVLSVEKARGVPEAGALDSNGLYELRRKKRWMGLGSVETFSLEEARQRARRARQLLADKIDPLEARRTEQVKQAALDARNKSFAAVTREYFDAHEAALSNSTMRSKTAVPPPCCTTY